MEEIDYPRLCGGTFLTLLLQVKRINKDTGKEFDDIQASVFSGNTAAVTTSKYKSCESENTGYLNIQRSEYAERARLKIEKEYSVCLEQMKMYAERYLRVADREYWLGHALLELLEKDQTIGLEEKFYFIPDGTSISKGAFLKNREAEK